MLSRHLVIKRRRWFYHIPVAVSSAHLKHVNPFNTDVLIMVIERKVSVVPGFNAFIEFITVTEFIMFTECMLFMRHLVSDCECWGGPGAMAVNPSPYTMSFSRAYVEHSN